MTTISVSRRIISNILTTKHDIKIMPFIDSTKEKHIDDLMGNELRVLNKYPVGYDFFANVIDKNKHRLTEIVKDITSDYLELSVKESTINEYTSDCGNHSIRQNLKRRLMIETGFGFVLIKKGKNYADLQAPFRLMKMRVFENGERIYKFHLLKQIFGSLITQECYKKNKEGYITIPSQLYPIITQSYKGILQSYNSIYRLEILGITRKTHGNQTSVEMDRDELLRKVLPEYYKNGCLEKSQLALTSALKIAIEGVKNLLPRHKLVSDLQIWKKGGKSRIYFSKPEEN